MNRPTPHRRGETGPAQLPGIEGFFVLDADGGLGRYQVDGSFVPETDLTLALTGVVGDVLQRYRAGEVDELAIGLVTADISGKPWKGTSLIFSDPALREVYKTSTEKSEHLTSFQSRNRTKSLFQGMEMILETTDPSLPTCPRYCPVFFEPEVSNEALCRRYGLGDIEADRVLEVLDLMAHLKPEDRHHPAFARMTLEMTRTRIAPQLRSGRELTLAAGAAPEIEFVPHDQRQDGPWQDETADRSVSFNAGDPVPYWLLTYFSPFNQLNDLQREFIARDLSITKRKTGSTLIERGSLEDISFYLVEGTIELEAFDGRRMTIVGGSKRAQLSISQLSPHAYTVRAETDVTIIPVRQRLVREVTRVTTTYNNRPGIEVREVQRLPDSATRHTPVILPGKTPG